MKKNDVMTYENFIKFIWSKNFESITIEPENLKSCQKGFSIHLKPKFDLLDDELINLLTDMFKTFRDKKGKYNDQIKFAFHCYKSKNYYYISVKFDYPDRVFIEY